MIKLCKFVFITSITLFLFSCSTMEIKQNLKDEKERIFAQVKQCFLEDTLKNCVVEVGKEGDFALVSFSVKVEKEVVELCLTFPINKVFCREFNE